MAKMCFAQLHGVDGKTVEGTASIYSNREELPPGQWSVRKNGATESIIMKLEDMPQHWQNELKRWSDWGADLTD